MISKYIKEIRLFEILYEDIDFHDENLKQKLLRYIDKYLEYKNFSVSDLQKNYESFLKQYSRDAKYYLREKKYPALESEYNYTITRDEYDIFLLLSTIFTQHRYEIMCEISQTIIKSSNALVVGSGVGLEIELIKESYLEIDAYDIELDKFCFHNYSDVNFYEEEFKKSDKKYHSVYIIELLEHIENPYKLIEDVKNVLLDEGQIVITLAVNIPQFDHLINFDDMNLFLSSIDSLGLCVAYEKKIEHKYLINGLSQSSNIFMILKKKR